MMHLSCKPSKESNGRLTSLALLLVIAALAGQSCSATTGGAPAVKLLGDPSKLQADGATVVIVPQAAGGGRAIEATFNPGDWPSLNWRADVSSPWNWTKTAVFAFDVANPSAQPVMVRLRIDDDIHANGDVTHSWSGSAVVAAGKTTTVVADLDAGRNIDKTFGLKNGGPTIDLVPGASNMAGTGDIDVSHITAYQIYLHDPAKPTPLTISGIRLMPTADEAGLYTGLADKYGQYTREDWPGKVHSDSDLIADRDKEARDLAQNPAPSGRDEYGGWLGGPAQTATGFFHTVNIDGKWWFVTPSGHLFLSFGPDSIGTESYTMVTGRDKMFTWLPSDGDPLAAHYTTIDYVHNGPIKTGRAYNFYGADLQRKYGADWKAKWDDITIARLKSWGMNTIAAWSDESLVKEDRMPYALDIGFPEDDLARVSSGSDYWSKMIDPFDPKFVPNVDAGIAKETSAYAHDPWLIGYYVNNEMSWAGGGSSLRARYGLAYGSLANPASSPAHQAFVAQLQTKYGTIDKLNTAWNAHIASWRELSDPYTADPAPNTEMQADLAQFVTAFATKYFTTVRDAIRKYDPNHLYMGCRFAAFSPETARAAGAICDVVSFNVYSTLPTEGRMAIAQSLGKPVIVTEFQFGGPNSGMFSPGLAFASSQAGRGSMYANYVRNLLESPVFVGAQWFQYGDEPLTGRTYDGENTECGLVSCTDRPYPDLIASIREMGRAMYQIHSSAGK